MFGTTGMLQQEGDPLGSPVLDDQGTIKGIRNIEDGSGILSEISAQNGITLKHNFTPDMTGAPVLLNATAASPDIASIVGGDNITITPVNNSIEISSGVAIGDLTVQVNQNTADIATNRTDIDSNTTILDRSSVFEFKQESDFPVQDATTITLQSKVKYVLSADMATSKRFIVQDGATLTASNPDGFVLTYTGTEDMFSGTDVGFWINNITLNAPSSNQVYNFSGTSPVKRFACDTVQIINAGKIGTFDTMFVVSISNSNTLEIGGGITIVSNVVFMTIDRFAIQGTQVITAFDLGSNVFSVNLEFTDLVVATAAGSIGISGLAASGNVPAGNLATVNDSLFVPGVTPLQNITNKDIRWKFTNNAPIPDTISTALLSLNGNATATVITAVNTPVLIAGTWVEATSSKFTVTAAGRATYIGEQDQLFGVDVTITNRSDSGTNKDITTYIAFNGSIISQTGQSNKVGVTEPKNNGLIWELTLSTNDYIEVWHENNSDDIDLVAIDVVLRIR
jgi:hypothetical protein